jgi:hypothetical protein
LIAASPRYAITEAESELPLAAEPPGCHYHFLSPITLILPATPLRQPYAFATLR